MPEATALISDLGLYGLNKLPKNITMYEVSKLFSTVPTLSTRKTSITKTLNNLVYETPDMMPTICALVTYSTQKWAKETRERMNFPDTRSVINEMTESLNIAAKELKEIWEVNNIRPQLKLEDMNICINCADSVIELVEDAVEWLETFLFNGSNMANVIRKAHFMDEDNNDITRFEFERYYVPAVKSIYEHYGPAFNMLMSDVLGIPWCDGSGFTSSKYAYHNTEMLIKIYPVVNHLYAKDKQIAYNWYDAKIQKFANGLSLLGLTDKALEAVRSFPDNGRELHSILSMLMNGEQNKNIAANVSTKRYSLYSYHKSKAINLMGMILWGYSTEQVMNGILNSKFFSEFS